MYDNDVVSDFEEYNYCDHYSDLYLDYDNFDCDFDFDFTDNTDNIDYTKNSILGFNVFSENLPRQLTAESKHTSPHSNVSLSDNYLDYLEYNSTKSFITVQKEKDMTENNMNSVTMFNFVSFNVEGLTGKINYSDFAIKKKCSPRPLNCFSRQVASSIVKQPRRPPTFGGDRSSSTLPD